MAVLANPPSVLLLSIVLFFIRSGEAVSIYPTSTQVQNARALIEAVIDSNIKNTNEKPFIAGLVRLAFHDCVGSGGCDGCINFNLDANNGLLKYTNKLDAAFDTLPTGTMSRADFYVFAGYVALEKATEGATVQFTGVPKFGREDCSSSPNENDLTETFPDAKWNLPDVQQFFTNDGFINFNLQDVVAILGAHSLGRAHSSNSGYEGKWLNAENPNALRPHSDVLDNFYYRQILSDGWRQVLLPGSGNFQWQTNDNPNRVANLDSEGFPINRRQRNMFLNVDMALRWDLGTPNSASGQVNCISSTCPASTGLTFLNRYGSGPPRRANANFIADFEIAFEKLVENKETESLQEAL